jgi:hypothetical protein
MAGVAITAGLVLVVSLVFAVDAGADLARKDACHLGMEFEVESVRTIRTSWLPPSATCEYVVLGRIETAKESRWRIYFPLVPAAALAAAVWTMRKRRPGA